MGVLIFTHDAQKYREGNFVEGREILADPKSKDLTIIVHKKRPLAKECLEWLPYVAYRLVYVCDTPPKIDDESVIYDGHFKKQDFTRSIDATMRWRDRRKAHKECAKVPVPLMLAFLKRNNNDIELWRMLAKAFTNVPEDYQKALIAYKHEPVRRMTYPKKTKKQVENVLPFGIRSSDVHWEKIVAIDNKVGNRLRKTNKEAIPKGVKKREQKGLFDRWI